MVIVIVIVIVMVIVMVIVIVMVTVWLIGWANNNFNDLRFGRLLETWTNTDKQGITWIKHGQGITRNNKD